MKNITFVLVELQLFGVSVAIQPIEGILNFALAYYRIKYPSPLYGIEQSDKRSSYVYFDAINKNTE